MEFGDQDIARAIALSLQDMAQKREVIVIASDSEEETDKKPTANRKRAPEAPKPHASRPSTKAPAKDPVNETSSGQQLQPTSTQASSFLTERAKLERERRERQKRLRPELQTHAGNDGDDEDAEDDEGSGLKERPTKRQHLSSSGLRSNNGRHSVVPFPSSIPSQIIPTIDQVFWEGELRQTANYHAEPRKDAQSTFKLTEILGKKSELSFAIMSSYALDIAWIYQFLDPSVPVIMVAQPDATGQTSLKNVLPNWLRTTPHLRAGRGCMHMKFMLLFYKTGRLRVVVSTANLIAYDYRDMENTVWLQDFPLRSKPIPHDRTAEDFPSVLQGVLHAVNVAPALKNMLKDEHPNLPIKSIEELRTLWDWSKARVHLVPSISGTHEGWPKVIRTGHPRLMQVVRKMGLRAGKGKGAKAVQLECQGSSLGIYTTQWFNEFHHSARGESAEDWLDKPKKQREKLPYPAIKVIYPTRATVQKSALGEQGGGTLFCRRKQWAAKNFPRDHFYDSKSKAGPVLMHSKMIVATLENTSSSAKSKNPEGSVTEDDSDDEIQSVTPAIGWAYVGSHNFTPSAWGTLSGSGFNPVLNITNYELGIVFPLKDKEEADRIACFQRPPRKYTPGEDEPWIQEESAYHQDG